MKPYLEGRGDQQALGSLFLLQMKDEMLKY